MPQKDCNIPEIVPQKYRVLPRLNLTVCPTDRFKVGSLRVCALLPNSTEFQVASACLLPVLRRGCQLYPTQEQLNRHLDDLYAADCRMINKSTGNTRCIGFASDMLESNVIPGGTKLIPELVELMAQLFFFPVTENGRFLDRYVQQEKRNLTDAIAALVNHPASYAMSRFMTAFCEDRQTVSPLTIEQVQALGQEQLLSLLHYIRHSACFDVFYVGQTTPEDIIREFRRCFLPILGEDEVPVRRVNVSPIAWRETRKIVNETGTAGQSHLVLGYRTPVTIVHPDFYAMMLCNEMLGGSPVSRLFLQVREMRSLCYSIGSEYVSDRGELLICCGIDRACRDQAMDSILEQITAIQQGDFEDQELESARALLLGSYRQLADNTGAITAFYSLRGLLEMNVTLDGCRTALAAVKREDVIRAACSLHPDTVYFLEGSGTEPRGDEEAEEEVSHLVG